MLLDDYLNLKNKPYKLGVELYAKLGKSQVLKDLFGKGETAFNRKKLLAELELLANTKKPTPKAEQPKSTPEPKFTNFKSNIPELLQPIHALSVNALKEKALLHNKLCEITTDELDNFDRKRKYDAERKEIQDRMVVLIATNKSCWDKIHYFNEHGKLPHDEDGFIIENMTIRELVNAEKAIPSYITKLNNRIKSYELDSPKMADASEEKLKFELRLASIKKAIDKLPIYSRIMEVQRAEN